MHPQENLYPYAKGDHPGDNSVRLTGFLKTCASSSTAKNIPVGPRSRRSKIILTEPFVCNKEDFMNALLQRCVAWMFLAKGIQEVDAYCLEYGTGWLAAKIETLGRSAKTFARLRGSTTVNYVDMKQAIHEDSTAECYSHLFESVEFPSVDPFPKSVPKITSPEYPIVSSLPSWKSEEQQPINGNFYPHLVGEKSWFSSTSGSTDPAFATSHVANMPSSSTIPGVAQPASPLPQDGSVTARRPACIHSFMPIFPPDFLYRKTEIPWKIDESGFEERLVHQKMELQMQLPQLQNENFSNVSFRRNSSQFSAVPVMSTGLSPAQCMTARSQSETFILPSDAATPALTTGTMIENTTKLPPFSMNAMLSLAPASTPAKADSSSLWGIDLHSMSHSIIDASAEPASSAFSSGSSVNVIERKRPRGEINEECDNALPLFANNVMTASESDQSNAKHGHDFMVSKKFGTIEKCLSRESGLHSELPFFKCEYSSDPA